MVAFVSFVMETSSMPDPLLETFDLDENERRVVAQADDDASEVKIRVGTQDVALPPAASRAVRRLLHGLATGSPVHLVPADAELTTQQAAELLGLSRTYVVRLIDQGTLPGHMVGTHRRLRASDVLAYRSQRAHRLDALDAITSADEDLGLPY
jgi:excisionase family DNA binding protein